MQKPRFARPQTSRSNGKKVLISDTDLVLFLDMVVQGPRPCKGRLKRTHGFLATYTTEEN